MSMDRLEFNSTIHKSGPMTLITVPKAFEIQLKQFLEGKPKGKKFHIIVSDD